jgi:Zn-dependent peptidase ImmA (M78 family)
LIERILDVRIEFRPLGDSNGVHVFGKLVIHERTMYLNSADRALFEATVGLERYTLAHEAGHFELHVDQGGYLQTPLGLDLSTDAILCRDGDTSPREYQAERFGAYLLMPEDMLKEAVGSADTTQWSVVLTLRDRFQASGAAMRNRLRALGYPIPDSHFGA